MTIQKISSVWKAAAALGLVFMLGFGVANQFGALVSQPSRFEAHVATARAVDDSLGRRLTQQTARTDSIYSQLSKLERILCAWAAADIVAVRECAAR